MLAFAKQGGHRHFEKLAQQVKQRGLHGGDGVDGDTQVEGLQAAARAVSGRKGAAHLVEDALVLADRLADHQAAGILQGLADALAAGHFAHAGVAAAVLEDHDIAREVGAVGAAEVQQHAVVAGDGDDLEVGDYRGIHGAFLAEFKEVC